MTTPSNNASPRFRDVLAAPAAKRIFLPAVLGRLAYGTAPLAIVLTIGQTVDSFTAAGLAMGLFGVSPFTLPLKSRILDRRGLRGPTLIMAWLTALLWAVGAGLALLGYREHVVYVLIGLVSGLAAPPLGPSMRSA